MPFANSVWTVFLLFFLKRNYKFGMQQFFFGGNLRFGSGRRPPSSSPRADLCLVRVCFKETGVFQRDVGQRFESLSTRARRPRDPPQAGRSQTWTGTRLAGRQHRGGLDGLSSVPGCCRAGALEGETNRSPAGHTACPPRAPGVPNASRPPPLRRCRLGRSRRLTRSRAGRLSRSQAE